MSDNIEKKTTEIYINQFYISLKATDSQLYLSLNGEPIVNINMSLITAKNFAKQLNTQIAQYEVDLDVKIEDFSEIQTKIDAFNEKVKEANKGEKNI